MVPTALLCTAAAALLLAGCGQPPGDVADLVVRDAHSPRIEGMQAATVYLELHNTGDHPLTLTGAKTDAARDTGLHRTVTDDAGRISMQPTDALTVPPDGLLTLREGGEHVMLVGLEPYVLGDRFDLTLLFGQQELDVEVTITELAS